MLKKCFHCGASLLDNVSQCSFCYRELDDSSIVYSVEGNDHIYVKRENEKVFGPFPIDRVVSLVKTGKLKSTEFVSDDRNTWVEVEKVLELRGDSVPVVDLPGLKQALPGLKQDLPGLKTDLPGLKTNLLGLKQDLPGVKADLPGIRSELPDVKSELPDVKSELPGVRSELPDVKSELPARPSLLPEDKGQIDESPREPEPEFSLPPIGGGAIPELKIEPGAAPLELKLDEFLSKAEEAQKPSTSIQPSFFETSDGIDFSSLSASGPAPAGTFPSPTSFSQEMTLPILDEDEDERVAEKPEKIEKVHHRPQEKGKMALLVGMLVIVAIGAAGFFLFSKNKKQENAPAVVIQKPVENRQVVSEQEKNFLEMNYAALLASAEGKELIHCESALALAWLFHDFSKIENCAPFAGHPLESGGDPAFRRFQFLRVMALLSHPKAAWLEKVSTSKTPVNEQLAGEILSRARSEKANSPFWTFLAGVFLAEKGEKEKSLEEFRKIQTTETTVPIGVLWYLAAFGDENAAKMLGEKKEFSFWNDLAKGQNYLRVHEKDFSLLFLPDGFPEIAQEDKESSHGNRFSAMHMAFHALHLWNAGKLDDALQSCGQAIAVDPTAQGVMQICRAMQVVHGQFGKILTDSQNTDWTFVLALLADGRIQSAFSRWEEWTKANASTRVFLEPVVNLLGRRDGEEWKKVLFEGLEANIEKTLEGIWVGIWMQPDSVSRIRELLAGWRDEKKIQNASLDTFVVLLDMVSSYLRGEYKEALRLAETVQLKGSARHVVDALRQQAKLMSGSTDEEIGKWAETAASSMTGDARTAAAVIRIYIHLEKLQEAHVVLDKMQDVLMDPSLYKVAAQLYLAGTRGDRLVKARFFAEKAAKISPQDFESLMISGFVQLEGGQFDAGEKTIMQAMSVMKEPDPRWFMRWSELESRLKRHQMAIAAMDAGLQKIPDHPSFLFRKAQILATQNKPREALELLEKTRNVEGIEEVQRHILVGRCHLSLREKEKAEKAFEKAVQTDGGNILARFLLGKTALSNGNTKKALVHLEEAVTKLEKAQEEQKIPAEAVHWQTETVESMLGEACRLLGGAYKETGNRAAAVKYFKKYAAMAPDGPIKDEAMRMLLMLGGD